MAFATLKNVTVNRVFGQSDQGASVYESFEITSGKRKGETGRAYFTLWSKDREPFEFDEGDVIPEVSGRLSVTLREYEKDGETKYTADATINDAVVKGSISSQDDEDEDEGF